MNAKILQKASILIDMLESNDIYIGKEEADMIMANPFTSIYIYIVEKVKYEPLNFHREVVTELLSVIASGNVLSGLLDILDAPEEVQDGFKQLAAKEYGKNWKSIKRNKDKLIIKTLKQWKRLHKQLNPQLKVVVQDLQEVTRGGKFSVTRSDAKPWLSRWFRTPCGDIVVPIDGYDYNGDPITRSLVSIGLQDEALIDRVSELGVMYKFDENDTNKTHIYLPMVEEGFYYNMENTKDIIQFDEAEFCFVFPGQVSQQKGGKFLLGCGEESVPKAFITSSNFKKFTNLCRSSLGGVKKAMKMVKRLGLSFTGSTSLFNCTKIGFVVDENGDLVDLNKTDGLSVASAKNCANPISKHINVLAEKLSILDAFIDVTPRSITGLIQQTRLNGSKAQTQYLLDEVLEYYNYFIESQGYHIEFLGCDNLNEVEVILDNTTLKTGKIERVEDIGFMEVLSTAHDGDKVNASIQTVTQVCYEWNKEDYASFLANLGYNKLIDSLISNSTEDGRIKELCDSATNEILKIMSSGKKLTVEDRVLFIGSKLCADPIVGKRVKKAIKDIIKLFLENFKVPMNGFSSILTPMWSLEFGFHETFNRKIAEEIKSFDDAVIQLKELRKILKSCDKEDKEDIEEAIEDLKDFIAELKNKYKIVKCGKYTRILGKINKFPCVTPGEFTIIHMMGFEELEDRYNAEVPEHLEHLIPALVQQMKLIEKSALFVCTLESFKKAHAGCDFDMDHASVYTDKREVEFSLEAKDTETAPYIDME